MDITQADIDRAFPLDAPGIHTIHKARKAGRCEYGRRVNGGDYCRATINPGDRYVAGAHDFHAGPWSRERWCMGCVEHAISKAAFLALDARPPFGGKQPASWKRARERVGEAIARREARK